MFQFDKLKDIRPETYPKLTTSKLPDPSQKKVIFLGGGIEHFFNFRDTTMIHNMKSIKSKLRIDLKSFSQYLVNTHLFTNQNQE